MPRRAKGPRLYLKQRAGREAVWIIRDGTTEISTGCGVGGMSDAEQRLGEYILAKLARDGASQARSKRDPTQVGVVEVLALYAAERAPQLKADPKSTAGFIKHLVGWWGDKMVADVRRSTCRAYLAHRTSQANTKYKDPETAPRVSEQTARRELETLSGAIGYWHGEDTLTTRPIVWLPDKPESPRDALTRSQAAALLKASLGYRKSAKGQWERLGASARANRAHLRRFILIGLYTGTRHSAMTALLWHESPTQAWVDLDKGMVYRRGKQEQESRTKRRPLVKLPRRLLAHMRRWREADVARAALEREDIDAPALYTSVLHHGGYPLTSKIRRGFAACVRDAGLSEEITPHWMRHTCATWLMERGAEMWEAAAYTGMTTAVLEKHYGHHRPDHQQGAIRALGGKR